MLSLPFNNDPYAAMIFLVCLIIYRSLDKKQKLNIHSSRLRVILSPSIQQFAAAAAIDFSGVG